VSGIKWRSVGKRKSSRQARRIAANIAVAKKFTARREDIQKAPATEGQGQFTKGDKCCPSPQ
jgi:hypothetical protein